MTIVLSFGGLCLLLALGKLLRVRIRLLQRLYLPSSVIGGLLGLIIVQAAGEWLPAAWTAGWTRLPGFLINIVFAAMFLGVSIPRPGEIWRKAGPQLAYGQIVAWGQYTVGVGLVLFLLKPLFRVSELFGVIVPVGFEGGHGTAAGLRATFEMYGWAEGADFALASATVGILSAVIVGVALINWAARKGHTQRLRNIESMTQEEAAGLYVPGQRPSAGAQTVSPESVDSLALHLAIVGVAILVGVALKQGLLRLETLSPALTEKRIFQGFPLFPLCMIGGLLLQLVLSRRGRVSPVDRQLMQRVAGTALDFLVVAAISTIRVSTVMKGILPFAAIVAAGICWNVFCVVWLARRLLPNCWFERAIAEMGQSMGVTATGLLLLRAVDPEGETDAPAAFGYKQLLHEPFMGGGLWTSMAVPLIILNGPWLVFWISVAAIAIWLVVWAVVLRPHQRGGTKD